MSGSSAVPPIQIKVDGAQAATQAIDSITAAAQRMGAQSATSAGQIGTLRTQAEQAGGSFRNFGTMVGQAGYQVQDFAVQVASGQSAITAFVQQGSQLAGIFGPTGILVGAGIAVAGVAAQFLTMGENAQQAQRRAEAAFQGMRQHAESTRDVIAQINALFRSANENAAQAANATVESLRQQALARQSVAVQLQEAAVIELGPARRALAEQEARAAAELNRRLESLEGRRAAAQGRLAEFMAPFEEQSRQDLFQASQRVYALEAELARRGREAGEIAETLRRLQGFGTFDASLPTPPVPPANEGYGGGGGGGSRGADPHLMAGWQAVQQQQRDLAAYDRQLNQEWEQEQRRRERDLEQLEERNTRVTDRIVDYSAERFADLFDENGRGWEGMLDTFERTARSTLARIAAEMVLRPVIAPVVQALGLGALGTGNGGLSGLSSLLGLGGGGTALVGGYGSGMVRRADGSVAPAAGGGSLSEYGSYLRAGQSLFSAWPGLDIAGGVTGIGAVFNPGYQMATGVGFADSILNTPIGGTWAPASAPLGGLGGGLGTTVGPSIGQVGLGVAGIAGGAYGIYSGLQRGGIGGYTTAAGGAAGVVGGAAGLATAAGLGGALGGAVAATAAFAPYVAAALLIAGALLPGQKAGFSGGDVGVGIGPDGLFNIAGSGGKRWNPGEAVASVQEQISGLNALMQRASIRVQNAPVQPNGYWGAVDIWGFGGSPWGQGDPRDLFAKMRPYLVSDNPNIETMLRAGRVSTIEEYVGGADWIRQVYEPMIAATEATNAFVASIKAINDNFQPAIEGAQRLGLAEGALVRLREEQIADLYAQRDLSYLRGYQSIQQRQLVAQGRNWEATLLGFDVQSQDERSALIASLRDMGVTSADQAYWDRLYAYDVMRQTEQDTLVAGRNRTLGTLGTEFELRRLGALGTPESALQAFDIRANMEMEALRETLLSLGAAADDVRISMLAAAQATEREAIAKQQEQQRIGAGRDFLFDLTVGGLGGLAPEARYFAGLTAYNDARRSGDITRIADVARGFLPVARDFLGTSERYGELAAGIGRDVAALGGDPAGLSALLDVQAGSLAAMERIADVNGLSLDELRAMRGDINRMLSTIEALIARRAA